MDSETAFKSLAVSRKKRDGEGIERNTGYNYSVSTKENISGGNTKEESAGTSGGVPTTEGGTSGGAATSGGGTSGGAETSGGGTSGGEETSGGGTSGGGTSGGGTSGGGTPGGGKGTSGSGGAATSGGGTTGGARNSEGAATSGGGTTGGSAGSSAGGSAGSRGKAGKLDSGTSIRTSTRNSAPGVMKNAGAVNFENDTPDVGGSNPEGVGTSGSDASNDETTEGGTLSNDPTENETDATEPLSGESSKGEDDSQGEKNNDSEPTDGEESSDDRDGNDAELPKAEGGPPEGDGEHSFANISDVDHYQFSRNKRYLSIDDCHMKERVKWARANRKKGIKWKSVVFVDSMRFAFESINNKTETKVSVSIEVWSAISMLGTIELVYNEKPAKSSKRYIEIFENHLIPFGKMHYPKGFSIQMSNASTLRSCAMTKYLQENKIKSLDWPSYGFDIAPFESVWDYILKNMKKSENLPRTGAEYFELLRIEWNSLPLQVFKKIIQQTNERMKNVIKCKGTAIRVESDMFD